MKTQIDRAQKKTKENEKNARLHENDRMAELLQQVEVLKEKLHEAELRELEWVNLERAKEWLKYFNLISISDGNLQFRVQFLLPYF